MSEESIISAQKNTVVVTSRESIPYSVIADDLETHMKEDFYAELEEIRRCYDVYDEGEDFRTEGSNANYVPSNVRFTKAATLVNKEARFMFATPPDFVLNGDNTEDSDIDKNTVLQDFLYEVLKKNHFSNKLIKGAKDCLIGKRIAIMLNFNRSGITINVLSAFEFLYGMSEDELTKIVAFYNTVDVTSKSDQRWFKKTYELVDNVVYVEEIIYDGLGVEQEIVTPKRKTSFTYIPACVVLNDGLTGDTKGRSELQAITKYEGVYSKLANADIDADRKSMNPVRYAIDASPNSTKNFSIAPGAFWDVQSDNNQSEARQASVGIIESNMGYSNALKTTLDRVENTMYTELDIPNINSEQLSGVITSGKTLKALYWGLTVRCNEKMLAWLPALEFIAETIIDGGKMYPESIVKYSTESVLPDIEYTVEVKTNYALPEDEQESQDMMLAEVDSLVRSKKSYMKERRGLSDKEAEAELQQIMEEQNLFNNSVPLMSQADNDVSDDVSDYEEKLDDED